MTQKVNNARNVGESISTKWQIGAEFRSKNKWLIYSSKIARRILAAISENENLNQAKLAQSLDVSPQQISKIVKGKENLTLETIYKLSKALGVELISFPNYSWNATNNIELTVGSDMKSQTVVVIISSRYDQSYFIQNKEMNFSVNSVSQIQYIDSLLTLNYE